jgi:agmatine deiminase
MIYGQQTVTVYLSTLLREQVPDVATALTGILARHHVPLRWIENTQDIWCRDFMPIWVTDTKCVQFRFDPRYYKPKKYQHLRTLPASLSLPKGIKPVSSSIILDGGNVIGDLSTAAVTERVFADNPEWESDLIYTLKDQLQIDRLIIIPELPGDSTGHVDAMLRFVDKNTVLLNDFTRVTSEKVYRHIRLCLYSAGLEVITLPNNLHLNKSYDDATGDYINFLEVGDLIILPGYGTDLDDEVLSLMCGIFPNRKIEQVDISALTPLGGGLNCISWCVPPIPAEITFLFPDPSIYL